MITKTDLREIGFAIHEACLKREASWNEDKLKYEVNLEMACEHACERYKLPKELARLLYLALEGWWNDTCDWADEMKKN